MGLSGTLPDEPASVQDQDQHVIEACLRGDRAAQRALYERFRSDMFRVCLRYAANREDAEDYLQEGFITVFRDLQQFRGDGPLGGWIRMVMVRASLQQLRKKKMTFVDLDGIPAVHENGHSSSIASQLDAERLTNLIQHMPPGYRTVFNLYVVDGYGHEEIADMLGISTSTSKTQLFKARHWMQARVPVQVSKINS